jgi:hypothetical protein
MNSLIIYNASSGLSFGTIFPASKILKNIYILSNKQYPPSFIMDKIYKFEKDGNVTDLLGKENEDNINEENIEP